jgi:hypothetical protein
MAEITLGTDFTDIEGVILILMTSGQEEGKMLGFRVEKKAIFMKLVAAVKYAKPTAQTGVVYSPATALVGLKQTYLNHQKGVVCEMSVL